jgi:Flp pilus assembly pilin Flp
MLKVFALLLNFLAEPVRADDRGVTAVEYGLLLTMIAGVLIPAILIFGPRIAAAFSGFNFP